MASGRVLDRRSGSDSGGGAGVQADIKTVMALGGYASTADDGAHRPEHAQGVFGVVRRRAGLSFSQQMQVVVSRGHRGRCASRPACCTISAVIEAVAEELAPNNEARVPICMFLIPVMVAQSGASLLESAALSTLARRLPPLASVLTPNLPEAEKLLGVTIDSVAAMESAAAQLLELGSRAVLLKGGHLAGETVVDVLASESGLERFESPRIESRHLHGTGCTLASAIATGLAQELSLRDAVLRARAYLQAAIRAAPGLGQGSGPVGHGHTVQPFRI